MNEFEPTYVGTDPISIARKLAEELRVVADGDRLYVFDEDAGTWQPNGIKIVRRRLCDELGVGWTSALAAEIVTWLTDSSPNVEELAGEIARGVREREGL